MDYYRNLVKKNSGIFSVTFPLFFFFFFSKFLDLCVFLYSRSDEICWIGKGLYFSLYRSADC